MIFCLLFPEHSMSSMTRYPYNSLFDKKILKYVIINFKNIATQQVL